MHQTRYLLVLVFFFLPCLYLLGSLCVVSLYTFFLRSHLLFPPIFFLARVVLLFLGEIPFPSARPMPVVGAVKVFIYFILPLFFLIFKE